MNRDLVVQPEPDEVPAEVVELHPKLPPSRIIGVVRVMVPARGDFPWPPEDEPPSAA